MHETPLFLAAENSGKNNIETIKYLLEKGADLNCETVNKVTPIMIAAIEGRVDYKECFNTLERLQKCCQ